MALGITPRLETSHYDEEKVYDVMSMVTSSGVLTLDYNFTEAPQKRRCQVGGDVSQRITVVSVIMICTIVGNLSLVLALICKGSRRIKRVNVFLVNLAIGDLAVAVFTNTTEILFLVFGDWELGPAACKIIVYMQIVTLASTTFLLTAMSIDRYQVIVKPLQSLARRPRIWMKVSIAWVMAFIFATPQLFIFLQVTEEEDGVRRCCCVSKGYTAEWQRKAYLTFLTSYILLVPTAIMIYCYANIIHVIWIRARAEDLPGSRGGIAGGGGSVGGGQGIDVERCDSAGSPRMSMRRGLVTASKRRVITMTLTVVVGFLVCQTPYFIVSLVRVYSNYVIELPVLLAVSEYIVLMHSTLNPVLYGLFTLRNYHLAALVDCFTCRDTPGSRGERRLLLRGKYAGKSLKTPGQAQGHAGGAVAGQIYREPVDDAMCKRNGVFGGSEDSGPPRGPGSANRSRGSDAGKSNAVRQGGGGGAGGGAVCKDSAVCKDGAVCSSSSSAEAAKKMVVRQRIKGRSQEGSVPLLLITNTSAVEGGYSQGGKAGDKASSQHKQKRNSVSERSPMVQWERDGQKGSSGNDKSPVACPQWTPCHVDTNSESYSCV